jgi:OmpA-OmpF porin, OOP family
VRRQNTQELSVVTLTERTDIESPTGVLNLERKKQDMAKLQAGLFLKVRGHGGDQKELIAERISFHKGALKVTNQISSGQVELKEDQDAMAAKLNITRDSLAAARSRATTEFSSVNSRITDLGAYAPKFAGAVYFSPGSATLSDEAKMTLDLAASNSKGLNGSIVALSGFADTRGNAEANQRLSQRRVEAVVAYLTQAQSVPPVKIMNPTGMGTSHPIGDNDTAEGRALNRRVEIKVLVNKGINPSDSSKP